MCDGGLIHMLDGLLVLTCPPVWMSYSNLRHTLVELSDRRCHVACLLLASSLVVHPHHMARLYFNFFLAYMGLFCDVEVEVVIDMGVINAEIKLKRNVVIW